MEKHLSSLKCYQCKKQIWDVPFIDPQDRTFCCKSHGKRFFVSKIGPTRAKAIKLKNPPEVIDNNEISQIADLYSSLYEFRSNPTSFDHKWSSLTSRSGISSLRIPQSIRFGSKKPYNFLFYPISSIYTRKKGNLLSSVNENYFFREKEKKMTRKSQPEFSLFTDHFTW
jgi:hypothetical protein